MNPLLPPHPKGHFCPVQPLGQAKIRLDLAGRGRPGAGRKDSGLHRLPHPEDAGFGVSMLYACRGPVCDLEDRETFAALMEGPALAKEYRGYVIKIDPRRALPEHPIPAAAGVLRLPPDAGGEEL